MSSKRKLLEELEKLKEKYQDLSSSDSDEKELEFVNFKEDPLFIPEQKEGDSSSDIEFEITEPKNVEDDDQFAFLGAKPLNEGLEGPGLHDEIVVRWLSYLQKGVKKEEREKVIAKYPLPKNCEALSPPEINPEILECIAQTVSKNDRFLKSLQYQLGHGLTALGSIMDIMLKTNEDRAKLSTLADAALLFTNVHNAISILRKQKIVPFLNLDAQKMAQNATIDEFLFGKNFGDLLKNRQNVKKTSAEIRKPSWSSAPAGTSTGFSNFPRPIATRPSDFKSNSNSLNYPRRGFKTRIRQRGTIRGRRMTQRPATMGQQTYQRQKF